MLPEVHRTWWPLGRPRHRWGEGDIMKMYGKSSDGNVLPGRLSVFERTALFDIVTLILLPP